MLPKTVEMCPNHPNETPERKMRTDYDLVNGVITETITYEAWCRQNGDVVARMSFENPIIGENGIGALHLENVEKLIGKRAQIIAATLEDFGSTGRKCLLCNDGPVYKLDFGQEKVLICASCYKTFYWPAKSLSK